MNEMRRLINLVESAQHEQLDEGFINRWFNPFSKEYWDALKNDVKNIGSGAKQFKVLMQLTVDGEQEFFQWLNANPQHSQAKPLVNKIVLTDPEIAILDKAFDEYLADKKLDSQADGNVKESLQEGAFKNLAMAAGLATALAGAPQDAQASTDAAQGIDSNQPVATQQVQQLKPHQELDKDHYFGRKANRAFNTKFKFTGENPFAPGIKIDELMPYVKLIHSEAPAHFGKNTSKFKIVPSDHNKSEMMGVIEYEHGKLEIHMVAGGKLKSALVWSVNNTPIGSVKKYIPLFYNWHSKQSGNVPTEYSLD